MVPTNRILSTEPTDFGKEIRESLNATVVDQSAAVEYFVGLLEKYQSRLYDTNKPVGSVLFTGPSGSGKTFATQSFAEILQPLGHRDWNLNLLRVDCAEFQHSHEIAKLIGSPPGYLGHKETKPMLSQERIRSLQTVPLDDNTSARVDSKYPVAIILWDEIEKASDALWTIMLGILDHGSITLGTNEVVDLTQTIHVMTSNAGFSRKTEGLGFTTGEETIKSLAESRRQGTEAVKKKFTTEFINRLDGIIPFDALDRKAVARVLRLELGKLQFEVFAKCNPKVLFRASLNAQRALMTEGYDQKYNARNIKRTIDKHLRLPLGRIIGDKRVEPSEGILIDYKGDYPDGGYTFEAVPARSMGYSIHGHKDDSGDDDLL